MGWVVPSGVIVMTEDRADAIARASASVAKDVRQYERSRGIPEASRYSDAEVAAMSQPTDEVREIPASWGYPHRFWVGMTRILAHRAR